ncbi:MAG TPA: cob(I)yrinic acid a,c-diamide adenosyltransferase [Melioribacteraceae bacterium]|nr:cob(I)yrinic acid a,c-diamide adenosyltransferase [Melioribacteraceae bacterium]
MKIYTKTGDKGETSLFGGQRVWKDDLRIESYGTVDELNSLIGLTLTETVYEEIQEVLKRIQNKLFTVGADLATPDDKKIRIDRVSKSFIDESEKDIDYFNSKVPELREFILPGGTKSAALLHVCRTVCRRAERNVIALNKSVAINENILVYLNRLSDLFFVLARFDNYVNGTPDIKWNK